MGEKIIEDGREREIIKIKSDNENGYRWGYRDTMTESDSEVTEETETLEQEAEKVEEKAETKEGEAGWQQPDPKAK